jgi:RND family efflux transporter MFP subunit
MKNAILVVCIGALAAVISLSGCGKKTAASSSANNPRAAAVTIAKAKIGSIRKTLEVDGSLTALQDVTVGNKNAGRLMAVYPREGVRVHAGELVALMDTSDATAQLQSAESSLESAITRELQARSQLQQARNSLIQAKTNEQYTEQTIASEIAQAQAAVQTSVEKLAVVKKGARTQERKQAQQQVLAAKANFDKAKSDLKRYQNLFVEQAVSKSQLDAAQATYDSTQAAYNQAQFALALMQEGARPEEIRQAELAVQQAQDGLNKAQADKATIKMRQDDVRTAQEGVASAIAGVKDAQAGISVAKDSVKLAQNTLRYCYIKTPISGIVAERRFEPGAQLGNGMAILRIVNPATVYFQAMLSESQFEEVHVGQNVLVKVDALPGQHFSGRITHIYPVASAARNFPVRIDFNPDARLRPQMFARGDILIGVHPKATLVPKDAVMFDPVDNSAHVYIRKDGLAVKKVVRVGLSNPEYIEILQGLLPGDEVITNGQNALQSGDKIRVQQ